MSRFPFQTRKIVAAPPTLLCEEATDADFVKAAKSLTGGGRTVILLSGGPPADGQNRYSIAAWDPMILFRSKGRQCFIETAADSFTFDGDPLTCIDELMASLHADFPLLVPPFSGGAIGYLAYEIKNVVERLPQTAEDDLGLPDALLLWPRRIVIHDRLMKSLTLQRVGFEGDDLSTPLPAQEQSEFRSDEYTVKDDLASNFTHEAYLRAVQRVRYYIVEGDVYQVNLSQRYRFGFEGSPFGLWKSLFEKNPAPFFAYVDAGDHQVLSTSMERFLFRREAYIETRPIKGTRKRGANAVEDEELKRDLQESPKDSAELSMIVDLLRNDLGRVCSPRSIQVTDHKLLESYRNVHHLVSIVAGELRNEVSFGDIIRATFPGGSITGCPKIRAMEIIDELEPHVRHIYTGSIGYIGFHKNMDLNIAIRTAVVNHGVCSFSVGGGIVYDSDEEDEYQETLHKGRTLLQLVRSAQHGGSQ